MNWEQSTGWRPRLCCRRAHARKGETRWACGAWRYGCDDDLGAALRRRNVPYGLILQLADTRRQHMVPFRCSRFCLLRMSARRGSSWVIGRSRVGGFASETRPSVKLLASFICFGRHVAFAFCLCYLVVTGLVLTVADVWVGFLDHGPSIDYFRSSRVAPRCAGVVHGGRDYARVRMRVRISVSVR